jgi:hypothetical protein
VQIPFFQRRGKDAVAELGSTAIALADAHEALREIARQETRTANATVKRMAGIARAALSDSRTN